MYLQTNQPLTLGLLPEKKRDWRTFLVSYSFVVVVFLLILLVRLIWPDRLDSWSKYTVTTIIPEPALKIEKAPNATPKKMVKPLPEVKMETPKIIVPHDLPKPKLEVKLEPPKIQPANFDAPKLQPTVAALPKIIHTGEFGSSATPTLSAPAQKVQTGGFGDPNGLKGQGKQAKLVAANLGSFDLPEGVGTGNGTGGAKGLKGTIASAGFGNGIAQQPNASRNGQVQASGFGAPQVAAAPKHVAEESAAPTTQVEILYKPKPVYTEEARNLNIEGEVLLEVMFGANGELHVNRVVRGLGHGLDEAAINAANKIKFKPAQRNGAAVDSLAIVHVTFQMAS
ncbi:MAG TPA: energy transducer TonB [Terriglobales bacterium]|nr:energy transducer TonB [Terriglobales bacterium]